MRGRVRETIEVTVEEALTEIFGGDRYEHSGGRRVSEWQSGTDADDVDGIADAAVSRAHAQRP